MRVLFVCLGNICRSPTAEAVFREQVDAAGLGAQVEVDSCGLIDIHAGNPPDSRATEAAARRGYDLSPQRARRVRDEDFDRYDLVLGMDVDVVGTLRSTAPPERVERVRPFLGFDGSGVARDVPDPYYGGANGFENVLDLVEDGGRALLEHVRARLADQAE